MERERERKGGEKGKFKGNTTTDWAYEEEKKCVDGIIQSAIVSAVGAFRS